MNYSKFLIQVKNAQMAGKQSLQTPFSNMNLKIAQLLINQDYLKSAEKIKVEKKEYLNIGLLYKKNEPAITGLKFISKPSRRIYRHFKDLRLVRQGFGLAVISTSKGLMTNKEAKKNKIGGEYLFEIY